MHEPGASFTGPSGPSATGRDLSGLPRARHREGSSPSSASPARRPRTLWGAERSPGAPSQPESYLSHRSRPQTLLPGGSHTEAPLYAVHRPTALTPRRRVSGCRRATMARVEPRLAGLVGGSRTPGRVTSRLPGARMTASASDQGRRGLQPSTPAEKQNGCLSHTRQAAGSSQLSRRPAATPGPDGPNEAMPPIRDVPMSDASHEAGHDGLRGADINRKVVPL
jgi:hypothetical protein